MAVPRGVVITDAAEAKAAAEQLGGKVVTLSDSGGFIHDPEGLTPEKLAWVVELNADTLPRVLMDRTYYAEISGLSRTDEEKEFVSECQANANWLVANSGRKKCPSRKFARLSPGA